MNDEDIELFKSWGQPLPARDVHGTDNSIRDHLKPLKPHNWRQVGNKLIADTEVGELSQTIPTDRILTGADKDGMPEFRKIDIK